LRALLHIALAFGAIILFSVMSFVVLAIEFIRDQE
jgi:hypothetical protein